MNLYQFIKTLSEASANTAKRTRTTSPFKFYSLKPKQQEAVVESAVKSLNRNPFDGTLDIRDKKLLDAIQNKLTDYKYMNNLKNGKNLSELSSSLDKKADEFLAANADKISKDLEDYTTIPLDYEDDANRVDLSKFFDDEDNVLDQNDAIDSLMYAENVEPNKIIDEDPLVTNAKTYKEIIDAYNLNDIEQKGLKLLQDEPYTAVTYLEDQPELMKALAYRINWNKNAAKRKIAWGNKQWINNPDKVVKVRPNPNDPRYSNIPNQTDNQKAINEYLYNALDEEDRLYNTKNLPGSETEIDPYTGNAKNAEYKYADEPNYTKSGNTIEYLDEDDIINNKIDEVTYYNNEEPSKFTDNQKIDNIINASNRNIEQTKEQNRALNAAIYDWYRENISKPKNIRKNSVDLFKYIDDNSF